MPYNPRHTVIGSDKSHDYTFADSETVLDFRCGKKILFLLGQWKNGKIR